MTEIVEATNRFPAKTLLNILSLFNSSFSSERYFATVRGNAEETKTERSIIKDVETPYTRSLLSVKTSLKLR